MDNVPVDLIDPVLPEGEPHRAQGAVYALRRASAAGRAAVETLDGSLMLISGWSGQAAQQYQQRRSVLLGRCIDLDGVTDRAAQALAGWSEASTAERARMRQARQVLLDVQSQDAAARRAGVPPPVNLQADLLDAVQTWRQAEQRLGALDAQLSRTLLDLRSQISDRPLGVGDHAMAAIGTAFSQGLIEPARAGWALTGQAFVDRQAWWDDLVASVHGLREQVTGVFTHPVGTAGSTAGGLIALPQWRSGHYGEAVGSIAALFVPTPKWLRHGPDEGLRRWAERGGGVRRPKPTLQTVDEMLQGVDLSRHEHPEYGHTLARHVDVDDDYLMDRLTYGTIAHDGTRMWIPPVASRFPDRAVAEARITETLRAYERDMRAFAADPNKKWIEVTHRVDQDIGVVMRRRRRGFVIDEGNMVVLRLQRSPEGIYIETAFVGGS
jgi:hypothetical protein